MSLAGLLGVIAADPQLQRALSQGDADTDLVAPPALRPFLTASIASNHSFHPVLPARASRGSSSRSPPPPARRRT